MKKTILATIASLIFAAASVVNAAPVYLPDTCPDPLPRKLPFEVLSLDGPVFPECPLPGK